MSEPSVSQIRVSAARASVAQRLDALERKATSTLDSICETAATIGDTVGEVKNSVVGAAVVAKHTFNIPQHVREHPLESIAVAVGAGLFAAFLPRQPAGQQTGIFREVVNVLRRELIGVAEAAIAAGATVIKHNLTEDLPNVEHNGRCRGEWKTSSG